MHEVFNLDAKEFIFSQCEECFKVWRISFSLANHYGHTNMILHLGKLANGQNGNTWAHKLNLKQWFTSTAFGLLQLTTCEILNFGLCKLLFWRQMETLRFTWLEILPKTLYGNHRWSESIQKLQESLLYPRLIFFLKVSLSSLSLKLLKSRPWLALPAVPCAVAAARPKALC